MSASFDFFDVPRCWLNTRPRPIESPQRIPMRPTVFVTWRTGKNPGTPPNGEREGSSFTVRDAMTCKSSAGPSSGPLHPRATVT